VGLVDVNLVEADAGELCRGWGLAQFVLEYIRVCGTCGRENVDFVSCAAEWWSCIFASALLTTPTIANSTSLNVHKPLSAAGSAQDASAFPD
jgi:hypothetical protein